jgi:hypothetical protein
MTALAALVALAALAALATDGGGRRHPDATRDQVAHPKGLRGWLLNRLEGTSNTSREKDRPTASTENRAAPCSE